MRAGHILFIGGHMHGQWTAAQDDDALAPVFEVQIADEIPLEPGEPDACVTTHRIRYMRSNIAFLATNTVVYTLEGLPEEEAARLLENYRIAQRASEVADG